MTGEKLTLRREKHQRVCDEIVVLCSKLRIVQLLEAEDRVLQNEVLQNHCSRTKCSVQCVHAEEMERTCWARELRKLDLRIFKLRTIEQYVIAPLWSSG